MPSTKQEKWKMENQKGKRKCGVGGTLLSCWGRGRNFCGKATGRWAWSSHKFL